MRASAAAWLVLSALFLAPPQGIQHGSQRDKIQCEQWPWPYLAVIPRTAARKHQQRCSSCGLGDLLFTGDTEQQIPRAANSHFFLPTHSLGDATDDRSRRSTNWEYLSTLAKLYKPEAVTGWRPQASSERSSETSTFSENVVHTLLQQVRDGLVAQNERKMLSAFDAEHMTDYPTFRRQIDALFDTYESFRVHFTIEQSSGETEHGAATVEFEIEENPESSGSQPVRKQEELRFTFQRTKKGWKILDVDPRSFFS